MRAINDTERREVAKRLRGLDATITNRDTLEQAVDKFMKAVRGDIPFSPIRYSVRNLCGLAGILADIMDRPTCRNVADGIEFECSECGMQWNMFDRADALDQWARVRNPSYCPHCGRKVVRDGD